MDEFDLCTRRDEFIWNNPVWMARMSSGIEVWQDDDRENVYEPKAWIRLRNYSLQTKDYIDQLFLQFGTNIISIPKSTLYYYSKGLIASMHSKEQQYFSIVGILDGDKIKCTWFLLPALLPCKETVKSLDELNNLEIKGVIS